MSLRFKRHYPLILLFVFVLAFFTLVLGNQRIIAYTAKADTAQRGSAQNITINYTNDVALFDDGVVHNIQIIMDDEDYDQMISTFKTTGLKEYFHADILIDGVQVNDVGIRLKGNASLSTALGTRMGLGNQGGWPRMFEDGQAPEMPAGNQMPADGQFPEMPANGQMPADGDRRQPPGGFQPGGDAMRQGDFPGRPGQATDGEAKIPFLIKFDEYVDGQAYQGCTSLAIRNYGTASDAAMLQEPVTNEMVRLIGLPATQTAYTGFRINDNEETLYVISEILDEEFLAQHFENANGVLYKAELGSTLSYQGEDPSSYAKSFSQETRINDADLAPLIAFTRFLDQSDDATFEKELPGYLDVDAFAAYLAVNNLLVNTDSIFGMNNNYYLYYDDASERFTLLMWDANESLGKLTMGSAGADYDLYFTSQGGGGGFGGRGGFGGGENKLFKRFMACDTFKALYEQKVKEIYRQVFASGAISEQVAQYSALIHSVNDERSLVDLDTYDQAVQQVQTFIEQRLEYLKSTSLLSQ